MNRSTLNNLINLRGMREQAFGFALGNKGGMKQCYTSGCEIFTPLQYALRDVDLCSALAIKRMHDGENPVNWNIIYGIPEQEYHLESLKNVYHESRNNF